MMGRRFKLGRALQAINEFEHWLPKLKANGLIAGHDYTQEYINSVVPAVDTFFGKEKVNVSKSSWYVWISDLVR